MIDHQLRPLASFFEAITVPAGVYVRAQEFVDYQLPASAEEAQKRIDLVVGQTLALLPEPAVAEALAA